MSVRSLFISQQTNKQRQCNYVSRREVLDLVLVKAKPEESLPVILLPVKQNVMEHML
jgi:hypothetical protein